MSILPHRRYCCLGLYRAVAIGMAAALILAIGAPPADAQGGDHPKRIALWGSSVPNGTGDETNQGGYTGRLRELLEPARLGGDQRLPRR